jgi:hypothetical protein
VLVLPAHWLTVFATRWLQEFTIKQSVADALLFSFRNCDDSLLRGETLRFLERIVCKTDFLRSQFEWDRKGTVGADNVLHRKMNFVTHRVPVGGASSS